MDYELQHHGVKGMRWGVRRYQNEDGSLTNAGKKRDAKHLQRQANKLVRKNNKLFKKQTEAALAGKSAKSLRYNKKYRVNQQKIGQLISKAETAGYKTKIKRNGKIKVRAILDKLEG